MIRKIIAIVLVSFFIMTGFVVLNQGNNNYNIAENNINNFTLSSFNPYNYSLKTSISYSNQSSGITANGQVFGCYNNYLYYIYTDSIMQLNILTNKGSVFLGESTQPRQLEIYNNFMIIGFGQGSGYNSITSTLFQIYNFSNQKLIENNFSYSYNYLQFGMLNNEYFFSLLNSGNIYNCELTLNPYTLSKISSISITSIVNQATISGNKNSLSFAINGGGVDVGGTTEYYLNQAGFLNVGDSSLNTSFSDNINEFGNVYNLINLGNCSLLGSQSFYISNKNTYGTTQYSYNSYSSSGNLYFSDSSYNISFYPMNLSGYTFTKLPNLVNNSNYQEFCYNGKIVYVYLPIGSGNSIFNTLTYIINGNNHLIIVNKNNVYIYSLHTYNLNVKSYNKFNNQIQDYFSLNGIIYTGYSNSFSFTQLPQILIPLNTSTYYYNGSAITIIQSDFSGSGSNLYYNLSIYYNQVQAPSIPLYDIFTYMYPISIIGLFVGMGAFIFTIKKRGYKI